MKLVSRSPLCIGLAWFLVAGALWSCAQSRSKVPSEATASPGLLRGDREVYFEFTTLPGDTFIFKLTDLEKISEAREILAKKYDKHVVGTVVPTPQPYNKPWRYHLDPRSISFAMLTDPRCDGAIRYLDDRLSEVGRTILPTYKWCPASSQLVRELPDPSKR
jgi:hypothetical protein